jgi:cephalosporin-C deacetylase-like acetyl esterase
MYAMTRRCLIGSALAVAGIGRPVLAQQNGTIDLRDYSRCLPDYLEALAADAYRRRNARIAALARPDDFREYQRWARKTFLALVGPLPERTPLNLRTTGGFDRDGYRVENLVYESEPGFVITANLYLPKRAATPFPGVLMQMGHSANGKGYALYQRGCQGLAQLGYAVLAFDPMGQGERTNYPRPGGWLTRLTPVEEHTTAGRQMLLAGDTATRMQLWDAMRSLDVLASHPQIDPKRLASTGQSGGGTLTMILAAVDDRLAAAAVSCGNTENFATIPFIAPGSTDDAEQDFIGAAPLGFDRWDLLWPFAPKPLLVASTAHDFIGTYSPSYEASGREEFAKLERAYAALGAPDRLARFETPLPHAFSYPLRMAVYNWFERWLKHGGGEIDVEPPTAPERDETLWCGPTGNVIRDFGAKSAFAITRERANRIRTPDAVGDLRKLLGMDPPRETPRLEILARTRYADCDVTAAEVRTASKVWVPLWLFVPKQPWRRLLLILDPNGRNASVGETGLCAQLAGRGIAVCAADVRGLGDGEPRYGSGSAHYARSHQREESYAWASLILGRSLLGQRTNDIVMVARALQEFRPEAGITAAARNKLTVPALCAAALQPSIGALYLCGHLSSWRSLLDSEEYSASFANFVPGVLSATDLPQIAKSIAPRPIVFADESAWDLEGLQSAAR